MKVTHVITPINYGGGENLIINLINAMGKNVENSVVNLSCSKEFEKHLDKAKVKHYRISNKDLGASPSKIQYLLFLILNLFRSFGIGRWVEGDIIHAHGFPANIFIAFIRKFGLLKGKKLIFTSHSEKKGEKEIVRKFYIFFLKEFDKITCVGEKSYNSMIREFPELQDKIVQINNGIKVDSFYYKESDDKIKEYLGYSEEDIIAIYISRLSSVKNHKFLLELMKEIEIPNFKLLLIGEGEEKERLEQIVADYRLQDRVKLQGFVKNEELVNYYSISDMVLFPSSSEGFGISIVEGLACRKPLVLFENIYFRELGTGVLTAKSEEEFISQTRDLIISKEFRDKMAVEGEKVRENLSIEKCAENYEKLYGSLIYGKNINS